MPEKDVDNGWAWVILATSFITRVIIGGVMWALNQYFVLFYNEFGESKSVTAITGSVTYATYYSAAPLASYLIQRCGIRWTTILGSILATICYILNAYANGIVFLVITHGLFLGVGLCLISNASLISLGMYFKHYTYIVTGVSLAGTGVGVFIFALFVPYILDEYGWRGSMFIMAAVVLNCCVTGSAMYPKQRENDQVLSSKSKRLNSAPLLKSKRFWCLNFSQFFFCMSIIALVILFKDFVLTRNMQEYFAWNVAAFGIGDIGGRFLSGLFTSISCCNASIILCVTDLLVVVMIMLLLVMDTTAGFIILSLMLGVAIGNQVALQFILPIDVFGRDRYVVVLGLVQTTAGIGSLIGPPLAGIITDFDSSYTWTFSFIAMLQFVSAVLIFIVYYLQRKKIFKIDQDNLDGEIKISNMATNPRALLVKQSAQVTLELFVSSTAFGMKK